MPPHGQVRYWSKPGQPWQERRRVFVPAPFQSTTQKPARISGVWVPCIRQVVILQCRKKEQERIQAVDTGAKMNGKGDDKGPRCGVNGGRGWRRTRLFLAGALALIMLAACASSRINYQHPLVKSVPPPGQAAQLARVYFIRPFTERYNGPADNRLEVEADRFPLMKIAKGEYTLLNLVPGDVWITVTNLTTWGPDFSMKELSRSRQFRFQAGETYYVVFDYIDGEFRGAFFVPRLVDVRTARELTRHLRAVGLARSVPLS